MSILTLPVAMTAGLLLAGGPVAGPDLITQPNNLFGANCQQFGRLGPIGSGTVGLGLAPTACNNGDEAVHWFALPSVDHPVLTGNLYRLTSVSGHARLEQIGQSWLKHGFGAAQFDECGLGCAAPHPDNTQLGVGCSDPYVAGQSAFQCNLAPRSVIHPYTGVMPGGGWLGAGGGCDSTGIFGNYPSSDHRDHVHSPISHLLQVQDVDLMPLLNPGARYFSEIQYICPHEFTAGNGNQHNNVSHRELGVGGPDGNGEFTFVELAPPQSESPALDAWDTATQVVIEPAALVDGRAHIAYEVTPLGPDLWHYEYAVYNRNLDRGIAVFEVPIPADVTVTNIGFHAPRNHDAEPHADGYSNEPWVATHSAGVLRWSTTPFASDPFANAVRFGTLYNFRFDADGPPRTVQATVGLFKPGTPSSVAVMLEGPVGTGGIPAAGTVGLAVLAALLVGGAGIVIYRRHPAPA